MPYRHSWVKYILYIYTVFLPSTVETAFRQYLVDGIVGFYFEAVRRGHVVLGVWLDSRSEEERKEGWIIKRRQTDERQSEDIWSETSSLEASAQPLTQQQVPERTAGTPPGFSVSRYFSGGFWCEWCRIRSQCVSSCRRPPRTTTPPPRPASPPGCRAAGTPSASWRRYSACLPVCLSACLSVSVCVCLSVSPLDLTPHLCFSAY